MLQDAPEQVQEMVAFLNSRGIETWLIGSAANPTGVPPRDWDVIAFGNEDLLQELSRRPAVAKLDLLVVYDGDNFKSPWPRADGKTNSGALTRWEWSRLTPTSATYAGNKLRADGSWDIAMRNAVRVGAE